MGELPDRVVLDDGTVIVYKPPVTRSERKTRDGKPFQMREEHDDGSVTLRAIIPEHVIANLIECLHNEEYELIWEQMLSDHTKRAWENEGHTLQDFIDYFAENRSPMVQALNRIYIGLSSFDTVMEHHEQDVIEIRLRPSVARGMKFSRVRVIPEGPGLKLINVR